ncbi:hypothetical protein TNCV_1914211 [Trichonephila clavipes]|nr:hypothetical protein TNCV_1914211 [Trichonephila clavipes]
MSSWIQDQERDRVSILFKNYNISSQGIPQCVDYIKTKIATINGEIELKDKGLTKIIVPKALRVKLMETTHKNLATLV